MNTKTLLSLVFVASLFVTSCKKELEPQDSSETPLAETPANAAPAVTQQPQVIQAPTPPAQPVQQTAAAPVKTAPGMNPPHGQPNHRCDIAVGAPLNSPPGKKPQTTPTPAPGKATVQQINPQTVSPNPQPQNATPVVTAEGMNPPHGQAGHRCDIAVGAPLPKS